MCELSNCSRRDLDLNLVIEQPGITNQPIFIGSAQQNNFIVPALVWIGRTNRPLGKVAVSSSITTEINLVATEPGLQVISGIIVRDLGQGKEFRFVDLAHVFVLPASSFASSALLNAIEE
ncbi:hypothetical protein Ciccas_010389 [Cichlidogyrus casuarinus]|uniref:Trafficking protein particle complex subunit 13 C-terminal domain-containing protein n=1 Tax=Cichlidogyrus casuarinus TaxID=1844966 RepID=A0ABD2PV23_9PLAT